MFPRFLNPSFSIAHVCDTWCSLRAQITLVGYVKNVLMKLPCRKIINADVANNLILLIGRKMCEIFAGPFEKFQPIRARQLRRASDRDYQMK